MKRTSKIGAVIAALPILAISSVASASSHREAPAISGDPQADNTDLWAWTDGTSGTLHIVAAYNPLEEPSGGPNFHKFSDEVLYEIHISTGAASLADVVTYQIQFSTAAAPNTQPDGTATFGGREFFAQLAGSAAGGWQKQSYTINKIKGGTSTPIGGGNVAPPNAGPRTDATLGVTGGYNDAYAQTFLTTLSGTEGKAWAGPRDDGFYVDLGGIFDLANLRLGNGGTTGERTAQDGVAGFNCHAIALDVPIQGILGHAATKSDDDLIGVWASASRRKVTILRNDGTNTLLGPWRQVSRLGLPLVNEALIGIQDKDKYNRTTPSTDLANFKDYFLNPVLVKDAEVVGIYTAYGVSDPTSFGAGMLNLEKGRTDIVNAINLGLSGHTVPITDTGDVLRIDGSVPSAFPNGRPIHGGTNKEDDVTDIVLSLVLTSLAVAPGCGGPAAHAVGDCVDHNDATYLSAIPYLALPWRGYDQGHGKLTP
jgi:hypothetical protein